MTFGEKLKMLRESRGFTQVKLAEKLDVSKSNIAKYEHGQLEPNLKTLVSISRLFEVTTDYLLGAGLFGEETKMLMGLYRKTILKKLCASGVITPDLCRKLFDCDLDLCIEFLSAIITNVSGNNEEVEFSYSPIVSQLGKQLTESLSSSQIDNLPYARLDEIPRTKEQLELVEEIQSLPVSEQTKIRDYVMMFHRLNPAPVAAGDGSGRVEAK